MKKYLFPVSHQILRRYDYLFDYIIPTLVAAELYVQFYAKKQLKFSCFATTAKTTQIIRYITPKIFFVQAGKMLLSVSHEVFLVKAIVGFLHSHTQNLQTRNSTKQRYYNCLINVHWNLWACTLFIMEIRI